MRRLFKIFFLSAFLLFLSENIRAQVVQGNPLYDKLGFSSNGVSGGLNPYAGGSADQQEKSVNGQQQDSIPERKPRKPLRSPLFGDSLRQERIFNWTVNPEFNTVTRQQVDTLIDGFQLDYSYMKEGLGSMSLGNLAGATMPLEYFRRSTDTRFSLVDAWRSYIMRPENVLFYNAKIPYSRLEYEMSGQKKLEENLFRFIFSANPSPSTSFNVQYKSDGTRGMYMNQKGLDRYFTFSGAHTGPRYTIHGGYIYNYGSICENGGIRDDREVTDTVLATADQVEVKLKDAENTYRGNTIWWTQSYAIPLRKQTEDEFTLEKVPTVYVGQSFNFTKFAKNYSAKDDTARYIICNIDTFTDDTISHSVLDANFFAQYQPYDRNGALGLVSAGIGYERSIYQYYLPEALHDLYGTDGRDSKNSAYLYGGLNGKVSKYASWNADLKYYFMGYRSQDIDLKGRLSLSAFIKDRPLRLDLAAHMSLATPDYWAERYFSNHYAWVNDFEKEKSLKLHAMFSVPSIGLELGADYELANGKVYYDENSLPKQYSEALSTMAFYLQKNFRAGGFHFNHKLLAQTTSNDAVSPVPAFSAYLSYYFEFNVVKNVLRLQTGIDGRYNTKYYAFGWDPALGKFYNQREKELGGYPYLDVFVNAKWKRMLILVKLQHFNCNFFPKNQEYFQILHHPQNRMMLKLGASWSFYD